MTNAVQVFNYDDNQIRIIERNGDLWFVAKDVCNILGFGNYRQAIATHVDEDEKDVQQMDTPGGIQAMTLINESGFYTLVLRSNKPNAKDFRRWVTRVVLPEIRRTGFYATPAKAEEILNDPDTFIMMLQRYKEQKALNQKLEAKIEEDKPKVIFADSVSASDKSILVRDLAKLLRQNGYPTGEKRLYEELRVRGFIMKKDYANMPTQKSMEMGLMEVVERTINRGDGEVLVRTTTKITGKGQIYFINLFLNDKSKDNQEA